MMADAVFPYSDAANKKKRMLKEKLKFTRAPLLDWEVLNENKEWVTKHRMWTQEVSGVLDHCALCYREKCEPDCPIAFNIERQRPKPAFTGIDDSTTDVKCPVLDQSKPMSIRKQYLESEVKFVASLCKIKSKNECELDEIKYWKLERGESPKLQDMDAPELIPTDTRKSIKLKTLATGKINVIPAFEEAARNKTPAREKTPGQRLPPVEWSCKKNNLERRGNQLLNNERAKREREENLPCVPSKCKHQERKYDYETYEQLGGPTKKYECPQKITVGSLNNAKRSGKGPQTSTNVRDMGAIKHGKIWRKISPGRSDKHSTSSVSTHSGSVIAARRSPEIKGPPLTRANISESHRIVLAITKVKEMEARKAEHEEEIQRKSFDRKSLKDDCDFCGHCGALPCMNLRLCQLTKDRLSSIARRRKNSFDERTSQFTTPFGLRRVMALDSKQKRVERNRNNGKKLKLHPRVCLGTNNCTACEESVLYSRAATDYRAARVNEIKLKSCEE